jgi:hypothetical protein
MGSNLKKGDEKMIIQTSGYWSERGFYNQIL